jgi:hypothetical protein
LKKSFPEIGLQAQSRHGEPGLQASLLLRWGLLARESREICAILCYSVYCYSWIAILNAILDVFQNHYNLNLSREHEHWFVLRPIPAATNALSSFQQVLNCVSL